MPILLIFIIAILSFAFPNAALAALTVGACIAGVFLAYVLLLTLVELFHN